MTDPQLTPIISGTSTSSPRPQAHGVALSQSGLDVDWDTTATTAEIRNQCVSRVLGSNTTTDWLAGRRLVVITGAQCLGDDEDTHEHYPQSPQEFVQGLLPHTRVSCLVVSHACASTGMAVGMAADLCRRGAADAVLVCSCSIDGSLEEDTFRDARAWADDVRPFDADASGTRVYGFAGAVLIRGVSTPDIGDVIVRSWCARSVGGKTNSDPEEELRVMSGALERGRVVPTLVVAHATGTRQGDAAELDALEKFARVHDCSIDVLANKGAVGHGVFAAGIASVTTATRALQGHPILGSYGLRHPAREIERVSLLEESEHPVDLSQHSSVLVNCFGFSGSNVALILERKQK